MNTEFAKEAMKLTAKITNKAVWNDDNTYSIETKDSKGDIVNLRMDYLGLKAMIEKYGEGLRIELTPKKGSPIIFSKDSESFSFLLLELLHINEPEAKGVYNLDNDQYNAVLFNLTSKKPQALAETSPYKFKLNLLINAWEENDIETLLSFLQSKLKNWVKLDKETGIVSIARFDAGKTIDEVNWDTCATLELEDALMVAEKVNTKGKNAKAFLRFKTNGLTIAADRFYLPSKESEYPVERLILGEKSNGHALFFKDGNSFNLMRDNLVLAPAKADSNMRRAINHPPQDKPKSVTITKADIVSAISSCDEITQSEKEKLFKILVS